jgi:hypothetical protein
LGQQRVEVLRAELDRVPRRRPRERSRVRVELDRATRRADRLAKQQERIQAEEFANLLSVLGHRQHRHFNLHVIQH